VLNGYLRRNATELATGRLNRWASDLRPRDCPEPLGQETDSGTHPPLINRSLADVFMWMALTFAALAGLSAMLHIAPRCWRRGVRREDGTSPSPVGAGAKRLAALLPWELSLTMALSIIACILFLAGSNFLQMAETFVTLEAGVSPWGGPASSARVHQVMVYSVFYSIKKLIEEGGLAEFLAYVLVVLSGILPYAKLLAMMACWLLPTQVMSRKWRGRVLLLMDLIGKFSLADVFVIQFISGAMHTVMQVRWPTSGDSPPQDPLSLVLRTSQEVGFTAFVLATVGSLIIGHVCLHCHEREAQMRRAHARGAPPREENGPVRGRTSLREAACLDSGRRRRHVAPALLLTLALVVSGCALPAFTVTLSSPLGAFSEATHSLYGYAARLTDLAEEPNSFSTRFSQGTFIFFALISIHAHLALLLVAWLGRLSFRGLGIANVLGHVLFTYSAMDVAVISMILTLLELSTSNFVPLDDGQMALLARIAGRELTDHQGLTVGVALGPGTWLLAAAVLLHWCVGREVMVCLERAALAQGRGCTLLESSRSPSLESATSVNSMGSPGARHPTGAHRNKHGAEDVLEVGSPQGWEVKRGIEFSTNSAAPPGGV